VPAITNTRTKKKRLSIASVQHRVSDDIPDPQ
jgi:hypothetical protein